MTATIAVARASCRALVNHLARTVGGRGRLRVLVAAALVAAVGLDVAGYLLFQELLVRPPDEDSPPALRDAWATLLVGQALSTATLGLLVTMFVPLGRPVAVTARISGAGRSAIAVGESAPLLAGAAVIVVVSGAGPIWFVSEGQRQPLVTAAGLSALGLLAATAVATVQFIVGALSQRLGLPFVTARLVGFLAAAAALAACFTDLLAQAVRGAPSTLAEGVSARLWGHELVPTSVSATGRTAGLIVVAVAILSIGVARLTPASPVSVPARGPVRPWEADLRGPMAFGVRELLLALRHPTVQLALVAAALLGALLVAGARLDLVPTGLAVQGLALLLGAGAETAVGRTRAWAWLHRLGDGREARLWSWRLLGSCVPGAVLFVVGVAAVVDSPGDFAGLMGPGLAFYAVASAFAFSAGALLPFDDEAPTGMLATGVLVIALDGAYLVARSRLAPDGSGVAAVADLAVAALVGVTAVGLLAKSQRRRRVGGCS